MTDRKDDPGAKPDWAARFEAITNEICDNLTFNVSWDQLARDLDLPEEATNDIRLDLAACHTEPHRHYHTRDHITAVLRHLDELGVAEVR